LPDGEPGDIAQGEHERLIIVGVEIVAIVHLEVVGAARDADAVVVL
jgi:hypothetical protein